MSKVGRADIAGWAASPDDADALALTFAQPVAGRQVYTDSAGYTYTLQDREPRSSG